MRNKAPETITIGHVMQEIEVDKAINHPEVFVASDGLMNNYQGHPRAAGTFPRLISKYVKEKSLLVFIKLLKKNYISSS